MNRTAWMIVLVVFALSLLATLSSGQFAAPQHWEYSRIADNLLSGQGAVYDYFGARYFFYGPTLYPLLLAGIWKVTAHSTTVVLVLQSLIYAGACSLVYAAGRAAFGHGIGLLAASIAMLHPGNLVYAGKVHPQVFDLFSIVLLFYMLMRAAGRLTPRNGFWLGVAGGVAALGRSTMLPAFLLSAGWLLWNQRSRKAAATLLGIGLGVALVFSPVIARGFRIYGQFVPLRSDAGMNLWYGNHAGASGTSYTKAAAPAPVVTEMPAGLLAQLEKSNELQQNRILTVAAVQYIRENPAEALALFFRKLYYFWWFSPHTGLLYPRPWTQLYMAYYALMLALALLGLRRALRGGDASRRAAVVFLAFAACVSASQALFYVEGRHRWQIEPLLLLFSAAGLWQVASMLLGRKPAAARVSVAAGPEPLVSLCVPTANRAEFLARALEGMRCQTHRNLEILIGDNASTDETEALCRKLAAADPRIRYIRREKNLGIYPNHNALLDEARGEYVAFFHDDDEFDPEIVEREVAFLRAHPQAGFVSPDWRLIDQTGRELGVRDHAVEPLQPGDQFIERTVRSGQSCTGLSGTMIRRAALAETRIGETGPVGFADFVFWFEIAERWMVGHIPERLYAYRLHTRSLSRRSVLSVSGDYRAAMEGYFGRRLRRSPAERARVERWRRETERFLFWSLAYELSLHFGGRRGDGSRYRTVFELMEYRLTDAELRQALESFRSFSVGPLERAVRFAFLSLVRMRWTWPIGRLAPVAPALRGMLRLQ